MPEEDVVVVGEVVETGLGEDAPPESEHDPLWRRAVILVERVEKGDVEEGQRLTVAYASSRDVMWFRAPKPKLGERAVFQLHRLPELNNEFALVDPRDTVAR